MATITSARQLTDQEAVKRTLEVNLNIEVKRCKLNDSNYNIYSQDCVLYQPGDALGLVCPNPVNEVTWLIHR